MIFVNDVINHEEHKRMYLSRIEEYKKTHNSRMPKECMGETLVSDNEAYSNWLEVKEKRKSNHCMYSGHLLYDFFADKGIQELMGKIGKDLRMDMFTDFDWRLDIAWFQQYYANAAHHWHNHSDCQFTNVYFLELPNEDYKTEIIGLEGELFSYEAKEGQMITFPSYLQHRSKPNGNGRKTIISFNSSYQTG